MGRIFRWGAAALLAAFVLFAGIGSWRTFVNLDRILTVGNATAQGGEGWPAPQSPADIGFAGNPMAAYGYTFETVSLETELGPAPAWLVGPEAAAEVGSWAIFVHGIGGRRENGYRFLPTLREAGMPVLLISYRNDEGAPASPDGRYAFGLTEWRDLDTAARYALANGASSVVLVGESMGGGIVGQFLRQSDVAARTKAVMLDAPAIDFPAILEAAMKRDGVPLAGLLAQGGLWLATKFHPFDLRDAVAIGAFADFPGPLFISHGSADGIVPVRQSDGLVAQRRSPTLYLRTQADHIQSWKEDPIRYDSALLGFLRTIR